METKFPGFSGIQMIDDGAADGAAIPLTAAPSAAAAGSQATESKELFRKQAARFGTRFADVDLDRVDFSERPFHLWAGGVEYRAQSVIVATGASALWLGLDSETRLRGRGGSACGPCGGVVFAGQHVAVVGGGDT